MKAEQQLVVEMAIHWLQSAYPVWWISLIKVSGSAPREVGVFIAIRADGEVCGSISGGCLEEFLVERIQLNEFPVISMQTLSARDHENLALMLPCGGSLDLLIEKLTSEESISPILSASENQKRIIRSVCLHTGEVEFLDHKECNSLTVFREDEKVFQIFDRPPILLLIGATQVAKYLTPMAQSLNYQVVVCDPRELYQASWSLAEIPVSQSMPDDLIKQIIIDDRCAIITLAHDPKLDDMALMEALRSPAFYVAAMGSKKTHQKRRERLRQLDLSEEQIARLHGPAGIHIRSKRPAEIAISIMAEMIAKKNNVE